jgi:hypothetical protein
VALTSGLLFFYQKAKSEFATTDDPQTGADHTASAAARERGGSGAAAGRQRRGSGAATALTLTIRKMADRRGMADRAPGA